MSPSIFSGVSRIHGIHLIVRHTHPPRDCGVLLHESIQAFAKHLTDLACHPQEIVRNLAGAVAGQIPPLLRYARGQIPDALEVAGNLEDGNDESEIVCDRLVERQRFETFLFDIDLHEVDIGIRIDDGLRQLAVSFVRGPHGPADVFLYVRPERGDHLLEFVDLSLQKH
jgi:hypothetical protein